MQAGRSKRLAQTLIGLVAFTGIIVAGAVPTAAPAISLAPTSAVAQVGGDGVGPWENTALTS
jgi:hypothetical protein